MALSKTDTSQEKVIMTTCCSHCGGTCILKVHVAEGVITRIETDDGEELQMRACLKGRAYRQRVYAQDRLKYPMRRTGIRGAGQFERISWDEALDTVARELIRVKETYGNGAIFFKGSGGDQSAIHGQIAIGRLLSMFGGFTTNWGYYSHEGGVFAELATYGTLFTGNTRDNFLHSRLIIMWGWNPMDSLAGTNTALYLTQAKDKGARFISIDPRFTNSTSILADQWIPIIPGTDAAMLIAMAYVIIQENLQEQIFLDTYTVGFDKFKDYMLGVGDNVAKTPAWAEGITGVPASTIASLAREYATTKPAALIAGIAPGRTAYGEQYHRVAITLAAMTGNTARIGGDPASRSWAGTTSDALPFMKWGPGLGGKPNPMEKVLPTPKNILPARKNYYRGKGIATQAKIADALLTGKAGGYPNDYKLLYIANTNYPNQYLNINRVVRSLMGMEFIVVQEQCMTPAARFADILLPTNTYMERNDLVMGGAPPYYGFQNKVIDSLYESKSHLEIARELAPRLGIHDYLDKSEEELLQDMVKGSTVPDYETFKSGGSYRVNLSEPHLAFRAQIEDSKNNPFPTASGKIEIYSQLLADLGNPMIPPIPKYIETWESRNDPLAKKYPLQLITTHPRRRAHTQYESLPWLRETHDQVVTMNLDDAKDRGICDGELARVFNDRGVTILPARVTRSIMRGVVEIPEGAWYNPDENGVDRGGNPNVLTKDESSPGGAFCSNTGLVQVERA